MLNYVHSSVICHSQNLETTQMTLKQRMDKENVVQLHNGVLHSRKNNDILKFANKWMDLESIILSEVTQIQIDNYHMYSLISGF